MSELEQEFPEKIVAQSVDATTPANAEIVKELGFGNHGLVIRSSEGTAVWKQPDHEVDMVQVRKALEDLLK